MSVDGDVSATSGEVAPRAQVLIRPVTERDEAAERAFISRLSFDSRRYRFLGAVAVPSDALVRQLTHVDILHDVAFAAVVPESAGDRFIGVARYSVDASGSCCECAVVVADDWQGRGVGTALMRHLIDLARAQGL